MKLTANQTSFIGGISYSEKEGDPNSYAFGMAIDHRSEPTSLTLNPRAEKDSGSYILDLPMWGARAGDRTFFYDLSGNIYQLENSAYSLAHTSANSQGNGLSYFTQDGHLYYAQDKTFGRLTDAETGVDFYDDFKSSEGGDPTNTNSIDFESSSSMYASRADTASLSITSDLTLEAYIKPESLPTTGNYMALISKWDEQSNQRSYKLDITTSTNFFGNGSDGALTISSNTTEAPIDSACSGTVNTYTLSATNANFVAGQKILIHQTRGTNAGVYQLTTISAYTAGTITTADKLSISYNSTGANKAQVRVMKQYTNVTINSGITYTCKAWNGTVGGILGFLASGTVTITGTITATGKGFLGGNGPASTLDDGWSGEGTSGTSVDAQYTPNGNGGGGATKADPDESRAASGGGGGYSGEGGWGFNSGPNEAARPGQGGYTAGDALLTNLVFGGGGGGGSSGYPGSTYVPATKGSGGAGGGAIMIFGTTIATITGTVVSNGSNGNNGARDGSGGGGGGAGGSILIKAQTAAVGTNKITASGGVGGVESGFPDSLNGGTGSTGRIHLDYSTTYTGITSPQWTVAQDLTLATVDGYEMRLQLSADGTAEDTLSQDITEYISVDQWARWSVSWEDTTKVANFYRNGVLIGSKTGTAGAIYDSTAKFAIGTEFNSAGTAINFFDGKMDDVRVWNDVRTITEISENCDQKLYGTESNLVAYYLLDGDVTDTQSAGLNDLTASGSPTYTTDVPFNGKTTRADQDQTNNQTGQTYTLATSIAETATHRQTFVPAKDPQKSIELDIGAVGTGNWTVTVHDSLNRTIATSTVLVAELHTGVYEFFWSSIWRPIIGASYHFHVTSTVADGTVVTGTTADLETARFWTHYQFLVEDTYHPMEQFLDFLVIGNEKYLAKFEAGDSYDPHRLTFSSGWRVRCLGFWREFIAIGCWKGDAITDYDQGRIFFWDGVSDTYNHSIPVPEGGVNAMFGTQDVLFIVAGYTGEILIYTGGGAAQKYNKIPKLAKNKYIEIAPGAINMWRSNIHFGVGLNTDSEEVHKGIYTIGTSQRQYPTSLGFDYPTSLGDQTSSTVKIGLIYPSGQSLYIGWQNNVAYGIDKISVDNDVYALGTVESLIREISSISKEGTPLIVRADFKPLVTGESIRVKYKADREQTWKEGDWEDTVGATDTRMRIEGRMKEIQVAVDLATTVSTSPTLLGLTIEAENESSSGKRA